MAQRAFQPESLTELNIIKFFLCADSSLPTLKSSCLGLFSQRYTDALCSKPVSKWTHSYVRIPKAPVFFGVAAVSSRGQCAFGQNPQLMSSCALWLLAWTLPIYLRTGSGKEPRREVPPLDAWRALASTLLLSSILSQLQVHVEPLEPLLSSFAKDPRFVPDLPQRRGRTLRDLGKTCLGKDLQGAYS